MIGVGGDKTAALVLRHKKILGHPINDPSYARENLVSLGETFVMLYFYYVITVLSLHYMVIAGVIKAETIIWMLIEANALGILNNVPSDLIYNRWNIIIAIITTIVAAKSVKYSFEILKAQMHPRTKKGVLR